MSDEGYWERAYWRLVPLLLEALVARSQTGTTPYTVVWHLPSGWVQGGTR